LAFGYLRLAQQQKSEWGALQALTTSEARKSSIVNSALDCIVSIDADGLVMEFNPAAENTFGYSREEMIGHDLVDKIISESQREAHRKGIQRQRDGASGLTLNKRFEVMGLHANGRIFPLELTLTREDIDGSMVFTAFMRDVSITREMADKLSYQASHDALTGLINRFEFEQRIDSVLERKEGDHCLLYMDLDQFKVINDTSGHAAGDELLRRLTQILRKQVRFCDTLARLGRTPLQGRYQYRSSSHQPAVADTFRNPECCRYRLLCGKGRWPESGANIHSG